MTWAAIVAFFQAIPKLVDAANSIAASIQSLAQAHADNQVRELKTKIRELEVSINAITTDEARAVLAKQLSDLSHRIK